MYEIAGEEGQVAEALRKKLAEAVGVTLNGNHLTMRFHLDDQLVQVSSVITEILTPTEGRAQAEESKRMELFLSKYRKKFPDLEAELYYVQMGEWPK